MAGNFVTGGLVNRNAYSESRREAIKISRSPLGTEFFIPLPRSGAQNHLRSGSSSGGFSLRFQVRRTDAISLL
jgi:hypothetical protein